jgi:acetyl/propionyl-CoA carboxylase alpha subunit
MSLRKDAGQKRRTSLPPSPFRRVLIANRGEIAIRLIRACREVGSEAVVIYSDADREALHVRLADRAIRVGPATPAESYLRIDAIIRAAREVDADAVHPGYGFLAERAAFARAVEDAGIAFVGPPSEVIERLGDKLAARRLAREVGVPVVPGTLEPALADPAAMEALVVAADQIGFPLLVKASAGGGGRGIRRVDRSNQLPAALAAASAEALAAFGDGAVYLERELLGARHVEVQLMGDARGDVVALGERDCSLQRRHQKLVEEAPAPGLTPAQRRDLHENAARLGRAAGLRNAATAEFLVTPDGAFHFLEVNTRLQVEHGVTELVTGLDLAHEQLWIAAGRPLSPAVLAAARRAAEPTGVAIEVRIAAEDPAAGFAPTPGRVRRWAMPSGPGVRVDAGVEAGASVPPQYDNLIAKVMVLGGTRDAAIDRLARALAETEVAGIQTTLPFDRFVAAAPAFRDSAQLSTGWVDRHWDGPGERAKAETAAALAAALWVPGRPEPDGGQPAADPQGGSVWRAAALAEGIEGVLRGGPGVPRPLLWGPRNEPRLPPTTHRKVADVAGLRVRVAPAPGAAESAFRVVSPAPTDPARWELAGLPVEAGLENHGPERAVLHTSEGPAQVLLLPAEEDRGPRSPGPSARPEGRRFEVVLSGWRLMVEVESEARAALRELARRGNREAGKAPPVEVRAIIPGRVVAVAAAPGDVVAAGQALVVVEAMKMQNEVRAPRAGTVGRVAVAAGQTVEAGALMVVIE